MWQGQEGDGSRVSATPGKLRSLDEHVRAFDALQKRLSSEPVAAIAWLDKAVKEHVQARALALEAELRQRDLLFLLVEFPPFEHPIIFKEEEEVRPRDAQRLQDSANFVVIQDPEASIDVNPVCRSHSIATRVDVRVSRVPAHAASDLYMRSYSFAPVCGASEPRAYVLCACCDPFFLTLRWSQSTD